VEQRTSAAHFRSQGTACHQAIESINVSSAYFDRTEFNDDFPETRPANVRFVNNVEFVKRPSCFEGEDFVTLGLFRQQCT